MPGRPKVALTLAMEHVSGVDLRLFTTKLHKRPSAERYERCRAIGRILCEALEHIHSIGLVHRDVKPSNVLISEDDRVVLGDFGVVKDPDALDKTAVGVVVGTLAYAAPEQIQGEAVDARTDLFGLGATLYFVLTQRRPFEGLDRDPSALPTPPSRVDPGIPADLEGAIMRLLAANPDHRPRDAASVRALLSLKRRAALSSPEPLHSPTGRGLSRACVDAGSACLSARLDPLERGRPGSATSSGREHSAEEFQ